MNYVLYLVSANPQHIPDDAAIEKAADLLQAYFDTHEEIKPTVSRHATRLEFFSSGEDLEPALLPA